MSVTLDKPPQSGTTLIHWKLRSIMADRKMTNVRLAEILGITPVSISRLKNADILPEIGGETLGRLCDALNCDISDLLEQVKRND